jgi:hypothetical protein
MSIKNVKDAGKFIGNFFVFLFNQGINKNTLIKRKNLH